MHRSKSNSAHGKCEKAAIIISHNKYLEELRLQVAKQEREALESGTSLHISKYNRATMLRVLQQDAPADGMVDTKQANALRDTLAFYLQTYMPDDPSAHKWIILSCLYLSMIAHEPMHPQPLTGWQKREDGYYCKAREDIKGSVCRWCVCR